jgi:threonine synthase
VEDLVICVSTRGKAPAVSFREAVVAGLAPDGGLYVPENIPRLSSAWWQQQRGRSFQDLAVSLAEEIAGDEFDGGVLSSIIRDALNFPVPVVELDRTLHPTTQGPRGGGPGLRVVELFHGPTFAFKDFGARTLARLMAHVHRSGHTITILVATSGDTGGAVAHAFHNLPGTRVVVLYPEGQVSDVQEAQFTTLGGNVTAVSVRGTFDDCQRLAKEAFANPALRSRARLTSANSISLGRLMPQAFYHAYAALQCETPPTISVPSGNLGNLAAGVMAMRLGAPIKGFSAPTTINDTFPRYLASGRVEPRPSVTTLANAMDVGNPSNLERLRWLFNDDVTALRAVVAAAAHTDDDVRRAIRSLHDRFNYVADPHTAIASLGGAPVFLATAHPAKFREVVEPVIAEPVQLPDALAAMLSRKKVAVRIAPVAGELADLL